MSVKEMVLQRQSQVIKIFWTTLIQANLCTAGGAWYGGGWAPKVKLCLLVADAWVGCIDEGGVDGDEGDVLSLDDVGEVVAVEVDDEDDDGESEVTKSSVEFWSNEHYYWKDCIMIGIKIECLQAVQVISQCDVNIRKSSINIEMTSKWGKKCKNKWV